MSLGLFRKLGSLATIASPIVLGAILMVSVLSCSPGTAQAERLRGDVVAAGQDSLVVRSDGVDRKVLVDRSTKLRTPSGQAISPSQLEPGMPVEVKAERIRIEERQELRADEVRVRIEVRVREEQEVEQEEERERREERREERRDDW